MRTRPFPFMLLAALAASWSAASAAPRHRPAASPAPPAPAVVRRAADAIAADQLRDYLTYIASDEMEGRDTPSRGLDTTAKFLALHAARAGLKPAGDDGTFFQKIALRRDRLDPDRSTASIGTATFDSETGFLPAAPAFFPTPVAGAASGPVVYVGNGWLVKARNLDPYAGIDVKDKIVAVLDAGGGLPRGITAADEQGKRGEDWDTPAGYAARHGARGIAWIPSFRALAAWDRDVKTTQREITAVTRFRAQEAQPLPAITLSPAMLATLFQGQKQNGSQVLDRTLSGDPGDSFELDPKRVLSFTVAVNSTPLATQNVVAVLEGSDPALKSEYVAFGAHYDHVGMGGDDPNDQIFNGADDDGSGTTALLAMAEAFARSPRPRRSLLFVWHCGEEKGLWGSRYFTENPTVPLDHVVAQLNIDMIGRSKPEGDTNPRNAALSGPNQIYVIGSKMMSSELGKLVESVNGDYLHLLFDFRYDDAKDPNRFFFRSDHFNYARKGVPIVFFFDGVHEDYHRPSDTADKIDYQKMEKVTRTVAALAEVLANAPKRPAVDHPLPTEFGG
jgi:hypothetical protein